MRYLGIVALLLFVFAASAQAQGGPWPPYYNAVKISAVSSDIEYFNVSGSGATGTAANRQEVQHLSFHNRSSSLLTVFVYTKLSPAWDGVFSDNVGDDFVILYIPPGGTTCPDIYCIGFYVGTDPGTDGLIVMGWNGRP